MSRRRLYERSDGRRCAAAANGLDYSLCGDALEGGDGEDWGAVVRDVSGGPVTCAMCVAIIEHVRTDLRGVRLKPMDDS